MKKHSAIKKAILCGIMLFVLICCVCCTAKMGDNALTTTADATKTDVSTTAAQATDAAPNTSTSNDDESERKKAFQK